MTNAEKCETVRRLALANAGVRNADAQLALEQARAVTTSDELTALRAHASGCDGASMRLRATLRPVINENEVWGTSNRLFGSPHLPVPLPQQSADDEPIEPCAPRDVIVATAWIIAWTLTVFVLAKVIGSI